MDEGTCHNTLSTHRQSNHEDRRTLQLFESRDGSPGATNLPYDVMLVIANYATEPNVCDRQYKGPTVHNVMVRFRTLMALRLVNREWWSVAMHPQMFARWRQVLDDFLMLEREGSFVGRDIDVARQRIEENAHCAPHVLSLVLGTGCQLCGAPRVRKVYWDMGGGGRGVRCCRDCLHANTVCDYHLVHEMHLDLVFPNLRSQILARLPHRKAPFFMPIRKEVVENTFFWSNDVLHALGMPDAPCGTEARDMLAQPWRKEKERRNAAHLAVCEQLRSLVARRIAEPPPSEDPATYRARRLCFVRQHKQLVNVFDSLDQLRIHSQTFRRMTKDEDEACASLDRMRRLRTLSPAVSSTEDVRRNEATEDEEDPTVIVHIIMGQVARSCVRDAIRRHLEHLGLLSRDADADSSIKRTVSHLLRPVLRKQRRLPRCPIRIQSLRDAHDLPVDDETWFLGTVWRCATMLPVRRSDMVRRVRMLLSQPRFSFAHRRKSDKSTLASRNQPFSTTTVDHHHHHLIERFADQEIRRQDDLVANCVFNPCPERLQSFLTDSSNLSSK